MPVQEIMQGINQSGVRIKMSRNVKRGNLEYDHEELLEEMQYADLDPEKYSEETSLTIARLDTTKVNYELIKLLLYLDDKKSGSPYSEIEGAVFGFYQAGNNKTPRSFIRQSYFATEKDIASFHY